MWCIRPVSEATGPSTLIGMEALSHRPLLPPPSHGVASPPPHGQPVGGSARRVASRPARLAGAALVTLLLSGCATDVTAAPEPSVVATPASSAYRGPSDLVLEKEAEAAMRRAVAEAESARVAAERETARLAAELEAVRAAEAIRDSEDAEALRAAQADDTEVAAQDVWDQEAFEQEGRDEVEYYAAWEQYYRDLGYIVPTEDQTQDILDLGGACDMGEAGVTICELDD